MGKMCENVKRRQDVACHARDTLLPALHPPSPLAQLALLAAAFCRVGAFCWPRKQLEVVQA